MLCEITIENVAVIEKATAVFGEGFTVLTGETGAGKSILIDSINAILGNRTSRDIVRNGAQKARIWARFANLAPAVLAQLEEAGYETEEELLLYREVTVEGKSSCRINGMPATAALLREICGGLINIHGQHDNQSLLNPAKHLGVLDSFAQNETLLEQYKGVYVQVIGLRSEIEALSMDEAEKTRRIDLLRYEVDEIEAAELQPGEEELLLEQRTVIRNSQNIIQALSAAYFALNGGEDDGIGGVALLGEAANQVGSAAEYATDLAEYATSLNDLYYTAGEIASDLQGRLSSFEFNGSEMNGIEERLDVLYRLKQKYGPTVEAVLTYGETAREQLEAIEFSAERLAQLESELAALEGKAWDIAKQLRQQREAGFEKLTAQIADALAFLNMPGIVMALQRKDTPLGPNGADDIEFYIATNPGETPKQLAKIASGGELSRIMLALKSALADRDAIPTVIYDEIDTGISGLAAGRIGKLLQQTAQHGRQVICVTHTAQVAAYAENHLLIQKQVSEGRTFTNIQQLDEQQRVDELARIMGGESVSDATRASAAEMLEGAKRG